MQEVKLKISGMTCVNCSNSIEKVCKKISGVSQASVSYVNSSAVFLVEDLNVKNSIKDKILSLGFNVLEDDESINDYNIKSIKKLKIKFIMSIILSVLIMYFEMFVFGFYSKIIQMMLSFFAIFYCGSDFFIHFIKSLRYKILDMNALVSLGAFFSFIYSFWFGILKNGNDLYFSSTAMIITFVLFGKYIEENIKFKANKYQNELQSINSQKANLVDENQNIKEISSYLIKKDDVIFVKEGEIICVDGVIIKGEAELDMSFLTGEFLPVFKKENDEVKAGSLILNGNLYIKSNKKALDSTLEQIKNLIFEASKHKMKISKIIDIVCAYFVVSVVFIAICVFLYYLFYFDLNSAFLYSLSVLLISCPCALGLATPIVITNAFSCAIKKSILIKNPNALELLSKIKIAIFDKTGTLSENSISIYKHNLSDENFKKLSSIQILSSHFLSSAFSNDAIAKGKLKTISGKGLLYEENEDVYFIGNENFLLENNIDLKIHEEFVNLNKDKAPILIYFAKNKECLGVVCLKNNLKKQAKNMFNFFKNINIKCFILSGDNENSVKKVANELEIKDYYHSFKPEDKLNFVKKIDKDCLFVGDGLNDSAAIKASNVSIVMNNGSDLSKKIGDFILLDDNLNGVIYCYKLAKKSMQIIKINLFWAFFYNSICIFVATGAISFLKLTPHLAALAMCFSSICVVLNSLRIRKVD